MTSNPQIICSFCNTPNPAAEANCTACGAPLSKARPISSLKPDATAAQSAPVHTPTTQSNKQMQQVREAGEEIEKISHGALYAYSLFWRTLAEAASIAIVGFAIGLIGGATGSAFWGVMGAIAVGVAVGFTIKISIFALFSAPVGLVIGAVFSALLYFMGGGMRVFVFTTSFFAVLASFFGGRRSPYAQRNLYEKLRPLIGAAGGLAFGLLGMLLGLGLRAAVNTLLVPV